MDHSQRHGRDTAEPPSSGEAGGGDGGEPPRDSQAKSAGHVDASQQTADSSGGGPLAMVLRHGFFLVLTVALIGVGYLTWGVLTQPEDDADNGRRAMPVTVETHPIRQDTIADTRVLSGTLQATSRSLIASRIGGQVERLHVNIGDEVGNGQPIAVLDDDEFSQAVEEARADLQVARAELAETQSNLAISRREFERVAQLYEREIASESEYDRVRASYEAAQVRVTVKEAQVTRVEARLRAAEVRLSYASIQARWPGEDTTRLVGERFVDEGSTIAANSPIVSLLQIDPIIAVVHVAERDYTRLRIGQQATVVSDSYAEEHRTGRIVRMSPEFRETSRQARVEIELENADRRYRPGMFIRAAIDLAQADNALIVPREALVRREGTQGVFVVQPDLEAVRFVPVVTGIEQGGWIQLLEPVELSGDVVTLGQHLLNDGSAIRIAGRG